MIDPVLRNIDITLNTIKGTLAHMSSNDDKRLKIDQSLLELYTRIEQADKTPVEDEAQTPTAPTPPEHGDIGRLHEDPYYHNDSLKTSRKIRVRVGSYERPEAAQAEKRTVREAKQGAGDYERLDTRVATDAERDLLTEKEAALLDQMEASRDRVAAAQALQRGITSDRIYVEPLDAKAAEVFPHVKTPAELDLEKQVAAAKKRVDAELALGYPGVEARIHALSVQQQQAVEAAREDERQKIMQGDWAVAVVKQSKAAALREALAQIQMNPEQPIDQLMLSMALRYEKSV